MKLASLRQVTRRRAAPILAAALLGAGLGIAQAAPANAATTAQMFLFEDGCTTGFIGVQVEGFVDSFHPNGMSVRVELWGSDTFSDDRRETWPVTEYPFGSPATHRQTRCVSRDVMDEDFGDSDEIYARVIVGFVGGGSEGATTNTVRGSF